MNQQSIPQDRETRSFLVSIEGYHNNLKESLVFISGRETVVQAEAIQDEKVIDVHQTLENNHSYNALKEYDVLVKTENEEPNVIDLTVLLIRR